MLTSKHAYYDEIRTAARNAVVADFLEQLKNSEGPSVWHGMVLASINQDALNQARTVWPKHYSDTTHKGFADSWETLHKKFRPIPAYFNLAVWQRIGRETVLQALALGKPSDGKTHLALNWVERSFAPNYLRGGVLLPILACAEEYARLLGCERTLIKDPVDPAKYARYGYEPYQLRRVRATYLCKEL